MNKKRVEQEYISALDLFQKQQYVGTLRQLEKVYALDSTYLRAFLLEAYIYQASGKLFEELRVLQRLIFAANKVRLNADERGIVAEAWSCMGSAYSRLGQNKKAQRAFLQAVSFEDGFPAKLWEYSNAIFVSNHVPETQKRLAQLYQGYRNLLQGIPRNIITKYQHKKIRIGYLSPDFRQHPVASFIYALLQYYNHEQFEVYCYAANQADDVTHEFQNWVDLWRNILEMDMDKIAEVIRADEIDILVDFSGHTGHNLLPVLAYQAAPIQISGIGYFNSTGMNNVNYFLGDIYLDTVENDQFFTEKVLRLPHTHFCYTPLHPMPQCMAAPCLYSNKITFGCFNNFAKVTDEMLTVWGIILQRLPMSCLLLKHSIFDITDGKAYSLQRMKKCGIPLSRVILQGFSADYLEQYRNVDIALDTYPYTGGLTTCEALYMGVPVISLYGQTHGSRFGYSLLMNAGLEELTAATQQEYIDRAVGLAQNRSLLRLLHENLRNRMEHSPLMDAKKYVHEMEVLYNKIYGKLY